MVCIHTIYICIARQEFYTYHFGMNEKRPYKNPQYNLRIPQDLKDKLTLLADQNKRSLNQEIADRLDQSISLGENIANQVNTLSAALNLPSNDLIRIRCGDIGDTVSDLCENLLSLSNRNYELFEELIDSTNAIQKTFSREMEARAALDEEQRKNTALLDKILNLQMQLEKISKSQFSLDDISIEILGQKVKIVPRDENVKGSNDKKHS